MTTRNALYLPGPSYYDDNVKKYAGWHHILELQRQAISDAGYAVHVPEVPAELVDQSSSFAKIASWSLGALKAANDDYSLIVGAPSYAYMMFLAAAPSSDRGGFYNDVKNVAYVWNNADWYRGKMLEPEYTRVGAAYPTGPVNQLMNELALVSTDRVIANSDFVKKTHADIAGIPEISIARWGVDSEKFHPGGPKPVKFTVLFVGGDPIRKGLGYLLEGIDRMDAAAHGVTDLVAVGCIINRPFPANSRWLGMMPHAEMPALMRQAHVLVLPTLEDGNPLSVQEAMASGLVPITTEVAAEVFEDGVSGFQIPYRDPAAIADRLTELLDDPGRLQSMSEAARARAETQTWARFTHEFSEALTI